MKYLIILLVFLSGVSTAVRGQSLPAIQWINTSGSDAADVLNSGQTFTTSFQGLNDVSITMNAVTIPALASDNYGTTGPGGAGDNPDYVTGFIGNSANGTGDGTPGVIEELQTVNGAAFTFNFSIPLDSNSRILIADVDLDESYTIQAFSDGTPVSLADWTNQAVSGQTGETSDPEWASWDPTGGGADTGTLIANTDNNLDEPLEILAPAAGQNITELIFTQTAAGGSNDNAGFQILEVPEPVPLVLISLSIITIMCGRLIRPSNSFRRHLREA